ncbi:gluconate kinase [Pullulanibacillus pueri]|uniref:Shikimate kinase n=1 Tax=Pullulanibacillus pueri TaxID=1437324 RepID=A0A8J2ZTR1_9BACL|nr:AAA family ATPase [Pullulanibacillus pueri]MBM7681087.1 gluconate kinase [Pullulanibacillus pueri]GGH76997.1 hypothetical protein GCM10007096_08240 [Pullulanibacillus pueri]
MKLILLFGPQAVGKMTVGQELEKLTGLKLFHNHMTIDLLHPFFGFGPETWKLSSTFREAIFNEVARSPTLSGLIFTFVWAFDMEEDWAFVEQTCKIFESKGADIYFVELQADVETRLVRNKTPHRLEHKPTKRHIEESEHNLKETLVQHRLNSMKGEIKRDNYIKIDNTHKTPEAVAQMIKEKFKL